MLTELSVGMLQQSIEATLGLLHRVAAPVLEEIMLSLQSFPGYVQLWIITTLERMLLLLSLVLNAYVCILFVKTWKFPKSEKKLDEERISIVGKFIARHSKILNDADANKDADENKYWNVPKQGTAVEEDKTTESPDCSLRPIPDECVICMNQYTAGERIIWSSNPGCIHCFHSECLRDWLLPFEPRNQLCPCCRQPYCLEKLKEA